MKPSLTQPFSGRIRLLVTAAALAINLLVLVNNFLHDPGIGYDAQDHLDYVYVLPYHLPTSEDTREFFSAPLPYLLPSLTNYIGREFLDISDTEFINGRTAQLANLLLSIGITLLLIEICGLIAPGNDYFKLAALILLGILPVYYKTFSQVRGEPYVVFFTLLLIHQVLVRYRDRRFDPWRGGLSIGLILGGLALSRQWGILVFPAFAALAIPLFLVDRDAGWRFVRMSAVGFAVAFVAAGWFYYHLWSAYGTITAFNREERAFSFANQPAGFYRSTGLNDFLLFKSPTRPTFNNLLWPTFYSEIWGDYWGFFVFIKEAVPFYGTYQNRAEIDPYLGRVNLVSLYPTLLYLAGLGAGLSSLAASLKKKDRDVGAFAVTFLILILLTSSAGYFWFLVKYPEIPRGTTIKATYMLHALVLLPLLSAGFLEKIRAARPGWYVLALVVCGLVFLHNLPAMITRYSLMLK